jgi:hypothetical protein
MSNGLARQSRLRRVAIKPEATIGTFTATGMLNVPAISGFTLTPDRGTGIIPRNDVVDGRAGTVKGVPGSYGWTLTGDQELQVETDTIFLPWVWTLMACGHSATINVGTKVVTLEPTIAAQAGYTGGTANQSPCALSIAAVYDTDGVADGVERARGGTGVCSLAFTAGERIRLSSTIKALVFETGGASQMIDYGTPDLQTLGVWEAQTLPVVATNCAVTFTDLSDATVMTLDDRQELSLDCGQSNPDIADPASLNGLAVSPVFWDDGATLTLSVAASQANDIRFFGGWRDGRLYSMTMTCGPAGNGRITVTIPFLQLSGAPSRQDADGKDRLSLTFRVVRDDLGDDDAMYSIAYQYGTP